MDWPGFMDRKWPEVASGHDFVILVRAIFGVFVRLIKKQKKTYFRRVFWRWLALITLKINFFEKFEKFYIILTSFYWPEVAGVGPGHNIVIPIRGDKKQFGYSFG